MLKDGTVGRVSTDSLDGQHPERFINERVTVHLNDENGNWIEVEGILQSVLEENI